MEVRQRMSKSRNKSQHPQGEQRGHPRRYALSGNSTARIASTFIDREAAERKSPGTRSRSPLARVPWRRGLNVLASLVLILAALPLMLLIALAIKLTSWGPILYSQPRVGVDRRRDSPDLPVDPRRARDLGGRIFRIYKFRTMVHDPETSEEQRWAGKDDPRVTRLGSVLRKYRLDELPQLFNVLKGDMNLVGPRPEQPEIFQRLREEVEGYQRRQRVLPGITGLAQVHLEYDQCLDDVRRKVMLDLHYVERESPIEDVRIMARTVPVVLFGKGAQ